MSEVKLDASGLTTPSISLGDNILSSEDNKLLWNGEEFKSSGGGGHNVGEQWISMDGTIPFGGLAFLGQTVSKETYIELYNWVETNGRFKTEAEWQSLYTSNNGNVSFYAKVDDNTFRMPSFKGYLKANTTAGGYTKEGLPNITGSARAYYWDDIEQRQQGAILQWTDSDKALNGGATDGYRHGTIHFDASRSSSIYGNSTHVTPETNTILIGVYAFNTIINPSNLDVESLRLNYVTKSNGEISTELTVTDGRKAIVRKNGARLYLSTFDASDLPGSFILRCPKNKDCTDYIDLKGHSNGGLTWGDKPVVTLTASWQSGTSWYRKYSDGWIEQGGISAAVGGAAQITVSLNTAFKNTNYTITIATDNTDPGADQGNESTSIKSKTTTSFNVYKWNMRKASWYACGY